MQWRAVVNTVINLLSPWNKTWLSCITKFICNRLKALGISTGGKYAHQWIIKLSSCISLQFLLAYSFRLQTVKGKYYKGFRKLLVSWITYTIRLHSIMYSTSCREHWQQDIENCFGWFSAQIKMTCQGLKSEGNAIVLIYTRQNFLQEESVHHKVHCTTTTQESKKDKCGQTFLLRVEIEITIPVFLLPKLLILKWCCQLFSRIVKRSQKWSDIRCCQFSVQS
jgi:hypothetical protein